MTPAPPVVDPQAEQLEAQAPQDPSVRTSGAVQERQVTTVAVPKVAEQVRQLLPVLIPVPQATQSNT
jgi:hypothetical protein